MGRRWPERRPRSAYGTQDLGVDAFGSPGLSVQRSFGGYELEILRASTPSDLAIREPAPHLAIVTLPGHDPERTLAYVRRMHGALDKLPIIGIAVSSSEDLAIAAFRSGCRGNLKFPYAPEELSAAIERCLAAATPRGASSSSAAASGAAGRMGASAAMRAVQSYIEKVATSPSTVLITGGTGAGKELAAELLHRSSGARPSPYHRQL